MAYPTQLAVPRSQAALDAALPGAMGTLSAHAGDAGVATIVGHLRNVGR
jgi:hypothetical protein